MSKEISGTVISTKMVNTVVVQTERKFRHPLYRKVIIKHNKFKAHYEGNDLKVGDVVTIRETRPISKTKHFIVVKDVVVLPTAKAETKKTEEKAKTIKAAKASKTVKKTKTTKKPKLKSSEE